MHIIYAEFMLYDKWPPHVCIPAENTDKPISSNLQYSLHRPNKVTIANTFYNYHKLINFVGDDNHFLIQYLAMTICNDTILDLEYNYVHYLNYS